MDEAPAPVTLARRATNLDHLRALAALAVMAGHSYALGGRLIPIQAAHWYDVPAIQTATGVWLFFVISGYVIARPYVAGLLAGDPAPSLKGYAVRRAFRIYPAYWIALGLTIGIIGWIGPKKAILHGLLLHNLVPGRQGAVLSVAWTLSIEVLFYAAIPFCAWLCRRLWRRGPISPNRLIAAVLVTWALGMAWTAMAAYADDATISLWMRQLFPSMWGSFCPGILLAILTSTPTAGQTPRMQAADRFLDAPRRVAPWAAGAFAIAAVLDCFAIDTSHLSPSLVVYDLSRPLYAVAYGLVVGAAMRLPAWRGPVGSRLERLGLMSYGIYLFHAVVVYWFVSPRFEDVIPFASGLVGYLLNLTLVAVIALPAAWLSWTLLEQPMIRASHRVVRRWDRRYEPVATPG